MVVHRIAQVRLGDVALAADRIDRFLAGKRFDDFVGDALVHDAVVRNLEIISEASRHIGEDLKSQAPEIPWRKFTEMGDWLCHSYESVSDRILWDSIQNDLPALAKAVRALLSRSDAL